MSREQAGEPRERDLDGRVALITGAARGIGLATAAVLFRRGARLALVDIDERELDAACRKVAGASEPADCRAFRADVSRRADVQHAVDAVVAGFGALDILVNSAGICPMTPLAAIAEEEWDRVLAVNLKGPFLCCQAALPHVRRAGRRGRIVNIASSAGQMGGVLVGAHYVASKAGLIGLTKTLARALAADGATANCVAPATTATDLTAGWPEEWHVQIRRQIPLGRLAEPDEIAAAVSFLVGDGAAFITGATLDVNGGLFPR